jgi:hypothetical protein
MPATQEGRMTQARGRRIGLGVGLAIALAVGQLGAVGPVRAAYPETSVLPDLVMLAPKDFSVQKQAKGKRWLRFDTVVINLGPGPFDVYGYQHPDDAVGTFRVVQRFADVDGSSWATQPTDAVMTYSGDGHNHWHVVGLQEWTLTNDNADVLRRGVKTGFCFWDNYRYGTDAAPYYLPSTTSACMQRGDLVPMGLSARWGDEYPSNIAFQYIDITGLPNGDYTLTLAADPDLDFVEADEGNNTSWARIRIGRGGVKVLSQSPAP